jgi:hypothetical protein
MWASRRMEDDARNLSKSHSVRGKMTPNQMNAAIPERRPATEEISGLIERVTEFGNRQVYSRNSQRSRESWPKTSEGTLL